VCARRCRGRCGVSEDGVGYGIAQKQNKADAKEITMGSMSKRKGAVGEREAAEKLNEVLGTKFRRGRQYHGGPESPDLAGDLPGLHVEVKRCERLSLYKALAQAGQDAGAAQVPLVMHRASRKPWVVIVEVDYLIRLLDVVDEVRARLEDVGRDGVGAHRGEDATNGGDVTGIQQNRVEVVS